MTEQSVIIPIPEWVYEADCGALGDYGITNFDGAIEDGTEEWLLNGGACRHAALNFNGLVYFENGYFYNAVHVYRQHVETVVAESLKELRDMTNEKYGSE